MWIPPSPEDEQAFPFPGRAGRGVRVAVIDSGVHVEHPHIRAVAGGVSVSADGALIERDFADRLGHGTAVLAAIQERAPEAEYWAVKLFDARLQSTGAALFRAIEWAIEQRMDLVNLSLGTTNEAHAGRLAELVERARSADVSLISARTCYPGCLEGVFGVSLDEECARTGFRMRQTAGCFEFSASGYPRPAPGIPPERNLHGISFAVANMTGFAARALEGSSAAGLLACGLALRKFASPATYRGWLR